MKATYCLMSLAGSLLLLGGSAALAQDAGYEGGRGLLTVEGPSGLFINPTSATLPKDAYTGQYCIYFAKNDPDVLGQGFMAAYGIADDLEVGAVGNYIDAEPLDTEDFGAGPFLRYRVTKDEDGMPQLGVGGYAKIGDDLVESQSLFAAAYKRLPISEEGLVRSVGLHLGLRQNWFEEAPFRPDPTADDLLAGYAGLEIQLPLRVYVVGEVQTKDDDVNTGTPYAFGLQWRASGIAMSASGINAEDGVVDTPRFFYGIGYAGTF